jgi:uncharacterized protein (DUF1697 family)
MFAFLRAINTGGRRLTNDELLAPFRTIGLDEVAAYQAAGNVTFRVDREPAEVRAELGSVLAAAYGFDAPVFVRAADELRDCVAALPFAAEALAATEGKAQISFLDAAPTTDQVASALDLVPADDLVVFAGRHWFWLPRAGISTSALPVSKVERIVGPMTMRTVATVERMLGRFGD